MVQASLLEKSSTLYRTPLYGMMGTILTTAESSSSQTLQQTTKQFWSSIQEIVEQKLTSSEVSPKGVFEDRLVHFVKCLYIPETEIKQKAVKVKFETPVDVDKTSAPSKSKNQTTKRNELGAHCKVFIHNVTLKSFDLAHKHFSTSHLRIFSQILELDPAEEVISKVISSCHGDVATETTSHYFVFEICIPWLRKVQAGDVSGKMEVGGEGGKKEAEDGDTSEEFGHIVKLVCVFLSVLEAESVTQLLATLYEVRLIDVISFINVISLSM